MLTPLGLLGLREAFTQAYSLLRAQGSVSPQRDTESATASATVGVGMYRVYPGVYRVVYTRVYCTYQCTSVVYTRVYYTHHGTREAIPRVYTTHHDPREAIPQGVQYPPWY